MARRQAHPVALSAPGGQMSLTPAEITEWAAVLAAARLNRVGCDPISSSIDLTIDDAYEIQRAGAALRLEPARSSSAGSSATPRSRCAPRWESINRTSAHSPTRCSWLMMALRARRSSNHVSNRRSGCASTIRCPLTRIWLRCSAPSARRSPVSRSWTPSTRTIGSVSRTTRPMALLLRRSSLGLHSRASSTWTRPPSYYCTTAWIAVRRRGERRQVIQRPVLSGWSANWPYRVGTSRLATSSSPAD